MPVEGGTDLWERAVVAFELRRTLSEFEELDHEDQAWAIATWRTKNKLRNIESVVGHERRNK